jgi:hypothetical protein
MPLNLSRAPPIDEEQTRDLAISCQFSGGAPGNRRSSPI